MKRKVSKPKVFSVWRNGIIARRVTRVTKQGVEFDQADQFGLHPCCFVTWELWEAWADPEEVEIVYTPPPLIKRKM